ncbi:hypothetical protein KA005_35695 [bacterium]|nr:hypothetical protein [bacterium]
MYSREKGKKGINRRRFISFTITLFGSFLFFGGNAIAQSYRKVALVVRNNSHIYSSDHISLDHKFCGGDWGAKYLKELGYANKYTRIPLAEASMALQHGICDGIVLVSSGSYEIEDLVSEVFRGDAVRIVYIRR